MTTTNKSNERYTEAVGRRKEAVERVRIKPASKMSFLINNTKLDDYFPSQELIEIARKPFLASGLSDALEITVQVRGGGFRGQADAVSLGLARALVADDSEMKPRLKEEKLLTRDARVKERKKFGLKKARKSPQWSKR